jgi:hypothetical protein
MRVVVWRFTAIAMTLLVRAVGSSSELRAEGSKGTAGDDLAATILRQVSVVIPTAVNQGCEASSRKSAGSQMPLVVRALAALPADYAAAYNIVILVTRVPLVAAVAVVPRHGVLAVSLTLSVHITPVGTDVTSLVAVVVLIFSAAMVSSGHLAPTLLIPDYHDARILSRDDDGRWAGGLLNNDLLGLTGALTNDNGRRRWARPSVVLCLLAIMIDVVAMSIFVTLLDPSLDPQVLVVMGVARTAVVMIAILALVDHDAITARVLARRVVPVFTISVIVGTTMAVIRGLIAGAGTLGTALVVVVVIAAACVTRMSRAVVVVNLDRLVLVVAAWFDLVAPDSGTVVTVVIGRGVVVVPVAGLLIDIAHDKGRRWLESNKVEF